MIHRIYFAGPFSKKRLVNFLADKAEKTGLEIVSSWHKNNVAEYSTAQLASKTGEAGYTAENDFLQIAQSEALVLVNDPSFEGSGCQVEFGLAVALGKQVHVIGACSNIFHCLPNVHRHHSFNNWLEWMKRNRS